MGKLGKQLSLGCNHGVPARLASMYCPVNDVSATSPDSRCVTLMLKKIAVFSAKAFVLYLALIVLWIDRVLFETAIPRHFFDQRPFIQSVMLVLAISAAISVAIRSKTPFIFAALCLAYSAFLFVFQRQASLFIALFCVLAAISFLWRNRFTEPLLVMLPVIAGAWVFLCLAYLPYLVGWANYVTGRNDLAGSILEGFRSAKDQIIPALIMLPVTVMHLLGKHRYVELYSILKSLRKREAA